MANDRHPVKSVHADHQPADHRKFIGTEVLTGISFLNFAGPMVRQLGDAFGQRQRRPLLVREQGRLPPSRQDRKPLVTLPGLHGVPDVHVEAIGAAVDL